MADLLDEILTNWDQKKRTVHQVAMRACLSERAIYDMCSGRTNTSVEVVKAAFLVTRDPRLRKRLEPEGWRLTPCKLAEPATCNPETEAGDCVIEAAQLLERARQAASDQRISRPEDAELRRMLRDARVQLDEFEALLDKVKAAGGYLRVAAARNNNH
jgi:hypothetical protein